MKRPRPWASALPTAVACLLQLSACSERDAGLASPGQGGLGTGGLGLTSAATAGAGTSGGANPGTGGSWAGAGGSSGAGAGLGGMFAGGAATGGVAAGTAVVGGGPASLIDPSCWDGQVYAAEPVPATRADITDLIGSFSVANRTPWSIDVLERRYPNGAVILAGATLDDPNGEANCYGIAYGPEDTTAQAIIGGFRSAVHECGHMMELQFGRYIVRPDLEYECQNDIWDDAPMRSVLLDDEFDALGPTGGNLDFQKRVYLEPTGTGNGGDQRWYLLFTEFHQYVNTLATSYAVYDYAPSDSIAGDASRDFAWFVQRYLRILRAEHETEYAKLGNDPCWRRLVLAAWGKVNRYWVESTKQGLTELVSDEAAQLDALILDPRLLAEIENLRVLDGCRQ